ncbi:MAG: sensor histidine kinase [Hyphomicrobiales bacterium]
MATPTRMLEGFLQTRTDRFIASARVAIAAFSLAAIWIDRSQLAWAPDLAYGVLIAYLAFSGVLLVEARRERVRSGEIALASHLVDLAVFSTLMFLTEGPTSPFFLLFTFSLVSATFRWRWKGALWTAVAVLVLLVAIALIYGGLSPAPPIRVEQFLTRWAHVMVIGAMLVYFGYRQQRAAEEAARLAAWQPDPDVGADSRALLSACLAHVANVFAAPRVVLMLQGHADPWPSVSTWDNGAFHQDRLTVGSLEAIVPEELAEASFMRRESGDVLVADRNSRLSLWHGAEAGSALPGYGLERVISVPVRARHATGRLFIADKQDFDHEELTLASLVAAQIGVLLDRIEVIEAAQAAATTEERLRLARDLHDGILQTLAGTSLQLEAIRRLADHDPASLPARIAEMQAWLHEEQRDMREFIGKLRPPGPWVRSGLEAEPSDLPALVRALEQQWGVTIRLPDAAADLDLAGDMEFHARHIVREAVANAVRHGGASEIRLQVEPGDGTLRLTIADNGRGLPQHGRFDARQCAERRIGPRSLRERIIGLGGSLDIDSTPSGVTLSIALPSGNADADADADHRSDRG